MKKICYIFAAGDFNGNIEKHNGDLIIAADAGFHHLEKMSVSPDIILGDFDTIGNLPDHPSIKRFPAEKDYTDTELAILEGIRLGYDTFIICGALGGKRLEHTVANIHLAACFAEKGYDITLTDGSYTVKALHNGSMEFCGEQTGFISVFPILGKAEGISIKGLKYELCGAVLDSTCPTLGVSNEFIGITAQISVEKGTVIIIWKNMKNNL